MSDYSAELNVATKAMRECAKHYMTGDRSVSSVKTNNVGSYDIVTKEDTEAENRIMDAIANVFPDDVFICEEKQNRALTDKRTWIIDPIDGTMNYNRGIQIFGTQLVLMDKKRPVMSAIYLPNLDEMFTATDAQGARLNGAKISPSDTKILKDCIISLSDFSRKKEEWRIALSKLIDGMYDNVARIKMLGAACTDFAMISCGRIDMHLRFVNNLWDFMPGLFLAERAGVYYDRELLENYDLLVMAPSEELCNEFVEKVVKDVILQL